LASGFPGFGQAELNTAKPNPTAALSEAVTEPDNSRVTANFRPGGCNSIIRGLYG
jgi:hypothetical protein